jgi:hypothetical protein
MMEAGDWSDTLARALTLMAIVAGPEIAEEVMIRDIFEDACRKADRKRKPDGLDYLRGLLDESVSLERAYHKVVALNVNEAPQATVEALMYSLRRGIEVITEPDNQRRLAELSEDHVLAVCQRLQNFKPNIAPAWSPKELEAIVSIWSTVHVSR